MQKLIIIPIVLALLAGLSACGASTATQQAQPTGVLANAQQSANSTLTALAHVIPSVTTAPMVSITPNPSPSPAVTLTALYSPSPQPDMTPATPTIPPQPSLPVGVGTQFTMWYGCYNAAFVRDVTISDGTVLAPGKSFVKTWMFNNTGTCAWPGSTTLKFLYGNQMQATYIPSSQQTNVGRKSNLSVSLIAPKKEGTYIGAFQMADKNGNGFGPSVFVQIQVSNSAITPSATP